MAKIDTKTKTAEEIFGIIAKKYFGKKGTTQVSVVEQENSKTKLSYAQVRKRKPRAKTLWILVETNNIRTEVRQEVFDMFSNVNYQISTGSSVAHLKITNFNKTNGIEQIRIMFKPFLNFNSRKYNWENSKLKRLESENKIKLNRPVNQDEAEVLKRINETIENNGGCVNLKIKNKTYKNVIGFNGGVGGMYATKADFVIINVNGEELGWISYKAGDSSRDFQQYSGITELSGNEIFMHPQVKSFREKIINDETIQKQIKEDKKTAFIRIKGGSSAKVLKGRAIFGKNYGKTKGANNVNWFAQGIPNISIIEKTPINTMILKFSKKLVENGNFSQLSRDYDPVIAARKGESGRKLDKESAVKGVTGIRGGIFPEGLIGTRNTIDMSGF